MPTRQPFDPAVRRFLDEQAALAPEPARTPEEARARMVRQLENRAVPGLLNGVTTHDFASGELQIRLYRPPAPARAPSPTLVYLHGGGWVAGSLDTHDPFCRLLAPLAGCSIVSVDYRLAPEAPYPAALDDAHAAFLWVAEHAPTWSGSPDKLALGGDSSGANLAAVTANRLGFEPGSPRPSALVLLYPVTDHPSSLHPSYAENATGYGLQESGMRWFWDLYAPGGNPDDPSLSPLRIPVLPALPPTLIATAEYDVLRDEGIAYAKRLAAAGVPATHMHAPDMPHNFPVSPATVARFPQSDAALGQIGAFLRSVFA